MNNTRHLVSRNKREGWYFGKNKMPLDFNKWLGGKNFQTRSLREFSLKAKWKYKEYQS